MITLATGRQASQIVWPTDLYDGVGEPWAGQARLNGRADFSVKTNPELFSENFGADPPTGSEIVHSLTDKAAVWG